MKTESEDDLYYILKAVKEPSKDISLFSEDELMQLKDYIESLEASLMRSNASLEAMEAKVKANLAYINSLENRICDERRRGAEERIELVREEMYQPFETSYYMKLLERMQK